MKLNLKLHKDKKPKDLAHFSYTNINTKKDWHFLLLGFLIVNILGVVWSAYLFFTFDNHANTEEPSPNSYATQLSRLHSTISKYEENQKAYEEVLGNEPDISDPSL